MDPSVRSIVTMYRVKPEQDVTSLPPGPLVGRPSWCGRSARSLRTGAGCLPPSSMIYQSPIT
jgi:hypothetical protein